MKQERSKVGQVWKYTVQIHKISPHADRGVQLVHFGNFKSKSVKKNRRPVGMVKTFKSNVALTSTESTSW